MKKKLTLKKETIFNLNKNELKSVQGRNLNDTRMANCGITQDFPNCNTDFCDWSQRFCADSNHPECV